MNIGHPSADSGRRHIYICMYVCIYVCVVYICNLGGGGGSNRQLKKKGRKKEEDKRGKKAALYRSIEATKSTINNHKTSE